MTAKPPFEPGDLVRNLPDPGAPEEVVLVEWEPAAIEPYWRVVTRWAIDGKQHTRSGHAVEFVRVERQ